MASWFFDNLAVLEEFDRLLEDVEEAHSEKLDGHPESLTSIPWDIDFLSGAPDVYTDAPGLKNNSAILQDEPSSTKPASGDAKPLPGRSIVKSGNTSDVKYPHPFQTTSSDSFTKPTSNVKPLPGRSIVKSGDTSDGKFPHPFQTTSPDSVLQSRNTHSVVNCASLVSEIATVRRPRTKRSRIKRQRTESFKLAPDIPYKLAAKKSCIVSDVIEEPKDLSMGHLYERYIPTKQKKEKNILPLSNASEMKKIHIEQPYATRKCTHCETTSTPQWREGPQGPKTLCNACGVRHRTGRLFPEYRPAGSPTFVASLHSNSHKKVIELRNKTRQAGEYCCKNTPSYLVKDTHNGWHSNSPV